VSPKVTPAQREPAVPAVPAVEEVAEVKDLENIGIFMRKRW
jgi:hypothetical protein